MKNIIPSVSIHPQCCCISKFGGGDIDSCSLKSPHGSRGVFRYSYHPTSRMLNFLHIFNQNRQILTPIQGNLTQNPKFLTDNLHGSHNSRVLDCNINTPLHGSLACLARTEIVYIVLAINLYAHTLIMFFIYRKSDATLVYDFGTSTGENNLSYGH